MTTPGSVPELMSTLWLHLVQVHCDCTWYGGRISEYIMTTPGTVPELLSALLLHFALCQN